MAPPVLLSRSLDCALGVFTGFFAWYLHETHPRTALPEDQRLLNLVKWKLEKSRLAREERNRKLEQEMGDL
ncbi:uncharacterized protein SCHCODRAFT_02695535 [Schizophyllum commune H4-8]|nr:uncharacterized protein SCHCODRAFT_02695535 [Schizophyllum commune H4-8]KAI5900295.1 hypothetical protein SCHCODRAFT_02695535 [Schizophyllum commune H4-8]